MIEFVNRHPPRIAPQQWMVEPATRAVLAALSAGGVEMRFVGGSVRDALLGRPMGDIDIATPAPPERIIELLEKSGIQVVPTGLAHGTVTAVVPPRHFEITTLRRDVETYGRRARVAFDADWAADAARRDFTINAIFLAPDGTIDDPVGGLADLQARRVRFVGDPSTRIAEDVLRLLRYYRFEARFGTGDGDPQARAACRAAAHLLPTLSGERVCQELVKLLETLDPIAALRMMAEDGVLTVVLPEARHIERLRQMIATEPEPDPVRRVAALVEIDGEGALALAARLRFSNSWRDRLHGLAPPWPLDPGGMPGPSGVRSIGSAPSAIAIWRCCWRQKAKCREAGSPNSSTSPQLGTAFLPAHRTRRDRSRHPARRASRPAARRRARVVGGG